MELFFTGILFYLLAGFCPLALEKQFKLKTLALLSSIGSILCLIPALEVFFNNQNIAFMFNFNPVFKTVKFALDPLSAFFVVVICVMSLMGVIYSNGYLKPYLRKAKNINSHIIFLTLLIASMLLVVTCTNALMFLIFWEIMSLSSFFLVIFESDKKEVLGAGIKYLVFMHISVIFIILAFAICAITSGAYDFSGFTLALGENKEIAGIVFALAFIGFGTKAGFVPFHNWLPDAHPAAPSHVSAIMSGVMIKTGIYGILRMLSICGTPSKAIAYTVLIISLISALYGVLYAITQHDLKRLLAYHSIENIGIIGTGIGVGMLGMCYNQPLVSALGFGGGILHILNHSIFKELLFLSAGGVYLKTHTRNIEILGGLIKTMPYSAVLFLIGSVAICALPPFNGFISEFLIYFGMLKGLLINDFFALIALIFAIAALALVGTMAVLCFTKAFSIIFLGMPRSENAQMPKDDVEKSMLFPMGFLAILALLIGVFPQYILKYVLEAASTVSGLNYASSFECCDLMSTISFCALGFILFTLVLLFIKMKFSNKVQLHNTWGCGYDRGNSRMQYSASSYASPFLSMLRPLFKKVFDIEKPKQLFPKSAHFSLHIDDIEEAYILKPLVKFDEWFLSKFEAMQSGNIQSYIKYGLIFLVLIIIGCLFIG